VLYSLHEFNRTLLGPATDLAFAGARMFSTPGSWLSQLPGAARLAAGYELLYRLGKSYEKPAFGIESVEVRGSHVAVREQVALTKPFCRLVRFKRYSDQPDVVSAMKRDPVVLLVAPLSGHHATLLRDAVRSMLAHHKVYITDWADARMVPLERGPFTLEHYVSYLREFIDHIGAERLHVVSVCQAAVPSLAAVALMAAAGQPQPRSLVMMGGPIDTRRSPTKVNDLATTKTLSWFETHLTDKVPAIYPGRGRRVYPGFLQHASFIAMNPLRHWSSHWDFYRHLVQGDLSDADEHRRFYDEYNAVLDLAGEYYLDCIRIVFQQHLLPRGLWSVAGEPVKLEAIQSTALLTVEGALDDISGQGQTHVTHELCTGLAEGRKRQLTVEGVGHYGIFSGRRWREMVYPQLREFITAAEAPASGSSLNPRRRRRVDS
jgi:poly(3-hydroxybutyrate) depolymerase